MMCLSMKSVFHVLEKPCRRRPLWREGGSVCSIIRLFFLETAHNLDTSGFRSLICVVSGLCKGMFCYLKNLKDTEHVW